MRYEVAVYTRRDGQMVAGICTTEPTVVESFLDAERVKRGDQHGTRFEPLPFERAKRADHEFWRVFGESVVYTVTEIPLTR